MTMDMSYFTAEVERSFRVLAWYQAEGQNNMDIRSWFRSGMISQAEHDQLRDLNQKLVKEYI